MNELFSVKETKKYKKIGEKRKKREETVFRINYRTYSEKNENSKGKEREEEKKENITIFYFFVSRNLLNTHTRWNRHMLVSPFHERANKPINECTGYVIGSNVNLLSSATHVTNNITTLVRT